MILPDPAPRICSLGDLIEDLVIDMAEPFRPGTDTEVTITRRRGGSAANVAAAALAMGARARFIGNVGNDGVGDRLVAQLESIGCEVRGSRAGRTGTVVALIDLAGERSLLTDRGSAGELSAIPVNWLDGLDALHVPAYAFTSEPLASVAIEALLTARAAGITTSIDASAVPVVEAIGAGSFRDLIQRIEPTALFCNADEAAAMQLDGRISGTSVTVVKNGPLPADVHGRGSVALAVPARQVSDLVDTTGAGDAFAAGFLVGLSLNLPPEDCAVIGHGLAARSLVAIGSLQGQRDMSMDAEVLP